MKIIEFVAVLQIVLAFVCGIGGATLLDIAMQSSYNKGLQQARVEMLLDASPKVLAEVRI